MSFAREVATSTVADARRQFADRNIELPQAVHDAVAVLDRIATNMPVQPSTTAVREAILRGDDAETVNALLLQDLAFTKLRSSATQARTDAAISVLRALRAAHDDIYPQLKDLADKKIEHLEVVARLEGVELSDLVGAGRHSEAQALVSVDAAAAELNKLYDLYVLLVEGGYASLRVDDVDCSRWQDPRPVERHHRGDETLAESFVNGLRHGAVLRYPTAEEAREAAAPIARRLHEEWARQVELQRAQGHTVAFA